MAIPQHTIDQILDRTDIVDLIGQHVKLKKTGRTYSGCCPFHQEKSPSFHVYRDKQYYHCFGCQANGNAIRFLMDIEQRNFVEVMKQLSSQTGIELPKDQQDSKRLVYKKETPKKIAPQATATPQTKAAPSSTPTNTPPSHGLSFAYDPFEQYQTAPDFDEQGFDVHGFDTGFVNEAVVQEGNLYDLLENVAQYYQQQLPHSQVAQQYFRQRGLSNETLAY